MTQYKSITMWKRYANSAKIFENYTGVCGEKGFTNLVCVLPTSKHNIDYIAVFDAIYNHFIEKCPNIKDRSYKTIEIDLDYLTAPHRMTAVLRRGSEKYSPLCIWSEDQAEQETAKQLFPIWQDIEKYYTWINQRVHSEYSAETIQQLAEELRIKEERRAKRALNDPDNPAARKRRARRHLQRLGYDLHKSRRLALTAEDRGQYQIVKLDSGEIIAGARFDLTLDQVEEFYIGADAERGKREYWASDMWNDLRLNKAKKRR